MKELEVACPKCTASKGFPCKGTDDPHPERLKLYTVSLELFAVLSRG